jgi:hypothetical protein
MATECGQWPQEPRTKKTSGIFFAQLEQKTSGDFFKNFLGRRFRGPQKLQEATASSTQLRPDSFERLTLKTGRSWCHQIRMSAGGRQRLFEDCSDKKKSCGKCLYPVSCVQLKLVLLASG